MAMVLSATCYQIPHTHATIRQYTVHPVPMLHPTIHHIRSTYKIYVLRTTIGWTIGHWLFTGCRCIGHRLLWKSCRYPSLSDAFFLYIQKRVQEFSHGVSNHVINTSSFYTIPDEAANPEDPWIPQNTHNIATPSLQIGRSNTQNTIMGPRLHVFH